MYIISIINRIGGGLDAMFPPAADIMKEKKLKVKFQFFLVSKGKEKRTFLGIHYSRFRNKIKEINFITGNENV